MTDPTKTQETALELSPNWEFIADSVMGGMSAGTVTVETVAGRDATRLKGRVSLDNNGSFIQLASDLRRDGHAMDASRWTGIELDLHGNDQSYDLRLRTSQLTRPWQSFRAELVVPAAWSNIRVPFTSLTSHRTDMVFDPSRLRRLGILAIGREFDADIAVSGLRFYRSDAIDGTAQGAEHHD